MFKKPCIMFRCNPFFSFVFSLLVFLLISGFFVDCVLAEELDIKMGSKRIDPIVAECLAAGHKAASEGNFDEAINKFRGCAEKHPDAVQPHFFLGMAFLRKREIEKAALELKKAHQLDPDNIDITLILGRLYSADKQKLGLARELLERVIAVAPYKDEARFYLARVYAVSGEQKKALEEFRTIFSHEPNYAVYHTEFAKILIGAGEKKAARIHLTKALALAPDLEPAKKLLEKLENENGVNAAPVKKDTQ